MEILKVNNLQKKFGSTIILQNINFEVKEGETLAVIGPSGSGKSTLLRCLNFLEVPDAGSILVNNEVIFDANKPDKLTEKRLREKRLYFGMVFQSFNLIPQYTALENVILAKKLSKKEDLELIKREGRNLLNKIGMGEYINYYPYQLSGGQKQRVAIARALALKPHILCFDEPTSALDPELTRNVTQIIAGLAEQKMTMIIVTHDINFARDIADQVIFVDKGKILERGSVGEVIDHPQKDRTKQFLSQYQFI